MSRLMSVAMTTDAVIERRKTATRRKGWWLDKNGRPLLHVGDTLTLCRKVQGRKPEDFVQRFFIDAQGIYPDHDVTRIEWRYVCGSGFCECGGCVL